MEKKNKTEVLTEISKIPLQVNAYLFIWLSFFAIEALLQEFRATCLPLRDG